MPTGVQMDALTHLLAEVEAREELVRDEEDMYHKIVHVAIVDLIKRVTLHLKQLQLEVVSLEQQLSDLRTGTRG